MSDFTAMTLGERNALLATAAQLQRATDSGTSQRLLHGKDLALLCAASEVDGSAAELFRQGAASLGARVACLPPSLTEFSSPEQVRRTARMLGRLYQGVECLGMSVELVQRIGASAQVPVFDGISSSTHPTSRLAGLLDPRRGMADNRCAVMQAVLVSSLG